MKNQQLHSAVLLLGSNLGERKNFLEQAAGKIAQQIGSITKISSYYETKSWGLEDQPDFLNQVLVCQTACTAEKTLALCLSIEKELGRNRKEKWGSRTIDIDILYFNRDIIASGILKVPHPFLQQRRFVLVPLCEVMPDFIHPIYNFSNQQLLEQCTDKLEVILLNHK
jgi:2-amino-4-hydroxy-6-hydroxymethyldihydropteridine diphosphokinase